MKLNKFLLPLVSSLYGMGLQANESGALTAFKLNDDLESQKGEYVVKQSRYIFKGLPFTTSDRVLEDKVLGKIEVQFVNFGESRITIQDTSKVDLS